MPQFTEFLIKNGLPQDAVLWLFMLPTAITIVVVARQVIGIRGIGITAPALIGFAFEATGIQAGAIIFLAAIALTFGIRSLIDTIRLITLPKIALVLLFVTLGMTLLLPFLTKNAQGDLSKMVFAFVILALSMEQFTALFMERGPQKVFPIALETLLLASLIFFAIHSLWFQNFVLSYPLFTLLAAVGVTIVLGKWTGLRVTEYMRFRNLIFK